MTEDNVITENNVSPELEEMARAGVLYGRKRSVTNPKMKPFIYTTRAGFEIFDLEQTSEMIDKARDFLKEIAKKGQLILFVGTRPPAHQGVQELAEKYNFPFVVERWLGGTLTNFKVITKRLKYYLGIKEDLDTGRLDKYTKKERVDIEKNIVRLDKLFGGLKNLTSEPAALVVVSAGAHETALREAKRVGIPVVAIANSNANPEGIDYLIPANDNNKQGIDYILNRLEEGIKEGVAQKGSAPKKEEK